jgi:hypothetical protein
MCTTMQPRISLTGLWDSQQNQRHTLAFGGLRMPPAQLYLEYGLAIF